MTKTSVLQTPEGRNPPVKTRITPYGIAEKYFSEALIRTMLVGLLFECPIGETASECQLCHIRMMPARERVRWLQGLGDTACRGIYFNHLQCLEKKV